MEDAEGEAGLFGRLLREALRRGLVLNRDAATGTDFYKVVGMESGREEE